MYNKKQLINELANLYHDLEKIKKVAKPEMVKLIKTTEYTSEFDYKEQKIEEVEAKETPKHYVVDGMRLSKSDFVEFGKAFGHSFRVTYKLANEK